MCSLNDEAPFFAIHAAIPPVFDSVVASITKSSRDLCPTLPHLIHHSFNHYALICGYWSMIQGWFQILMKPFSTLFGRPEMHMLGDANPVIGSLLPYQMK
jgi:hypothetical protein